MWLIFLLLHVVVSVRITNIHVPSIIDIRDRAELHCLFELGASRLNSIKWYKDEMEFYRYSPSSHPQTVIFPVTGIHILEAGQNNSTVILYPLEFSSTGSYICEISTEAPHFNLDRRHANMTVLGIPENDPAIKGLEPFYHLGDYVNGNCSAAPSKPIAQISWLINGLQANARLLHQHQPQITDNLETQTTGINFPIDSSHFTKRRMNLTCVARVATIIKSQTVFALLGDPGGQVSGRASRLKEFWTLPALWILARRWG